MVTTKPGKAYTKFNAKSTKDEQKICHSMQKFVRANRVFGTSVTDTIHVKDTRIGSHKISCKYLLRATKRYRFASRRDL